MWLKNKIMGHDHHHHHVQGKNLLFSIILNVIITLAQVIGGIISGSLALLSDALHNFSDVLSASFFSRSTEIPFTTIPNKANQITNVG